MRDEGKRAMIECRDAELLLQEHLDGSLLSGQREVLEGHLRSCPSCRVLLDDMRRLDARMEEVPEVEMPAGLDESFVGNLPIYREHPWRKSAIYPGLLAAAALLIAALYLPGTPFRPASSDTYKVVEIVFSAPGSSSVAVVGDFNDWDSDRDVMVRQGSNGVWKARLELPPGVYEYGFVIDGRDWLSDPNADQYLADGFGGRNALLIVEG